MARSFEMKIDLSDETDVSSAIAATTEQLERAAQRAMTKTAQWLRTHSLRELGQELGVKQEPLRKRFKVFPQRGKGEVRFWVGLDPIGVHRLGNPEVTATGVKVKRRDYDGAFIAPMKSSEKLVFRRKGKERLPLEKVEQDINDEAVSVIERWERRVFVRFKQLFEQEARAVLNGYA